MNFARLSDLPQIRHVKETWSPQFKNRVDSAVQMLQEGMDREEIRQIHGSVVLDQAEFLRK